MVLVIASGTLLEIGDHIMRTLTTKFVCDLSRRLVWHTDGWRLAGRSGAGVCGVRSGKRLSFSPDVHAAVFQAVVNVILACAK
jgi:hypothetical protein